MIRLLKAELIKLSKRKILWIVLAFFILVPIFQAFSLHSEMQSGKEIRQVIETVINGASAVLTAKKNSFAILFVMAAFVCFLICEEFQTGTIRNALVLGESRTNYFLSKFIVVSSVLLVGYVLMTLSGLAVYTSLFGFGAVSGISDYGVWAAKTLLVVFLLLWASVAINAAICFVARNIGISIILCFLYTVVSTFAPGLLPKNDIGIFLTRCFTNGYLSAVDFTQTGWSSLYLSILLASVGTLFVFTVAGIVCFKKMDIK